MGTESNEKLSFRQKLKIALVMLFIMSIAILVLAKLIYLIKMWAEQK
jgi:hypothetical protein